MACGCEPKKYSISMGCCQPVLGPVENYYTKYQIDDMLEEIESAITSGCCITPEEVDEKIESAKTEIETEIPSLSGYATEQWVEDKHYLTEHQPLKTINGQVISGSGNIEIECESGITSGEVQTMIDNSISGKQDTLSAGTNIIISGNVISASGCDLSEYVTFEDMAEYVGDVYTKTEVNNLFVSKDLFITTVYNLNQEINSLKAAISACCSSTGETEYRWIVVPNDYTCSGTTKMTKEKQQSSTDGINWTDTGQYRTGSTVLEYNSVDCGYAPSSNYKVRATYKSGYTVGSGQVECNSSTTITNDELKTQITFPSYFTSVEFGNCIDTIDEEALINGINITTITIPSNVTTIGSGAFADVGNRSSVSSLTVTLNEGLITIGNTAFMGCKNIKTIVIPNSVQTVGSGAFEGCSGLTSVTIGSGVTYIGNAAFIKGTGDTPLESVTIMATTPPTIVQNAFFNITCPIYVPAASVNAYKTANIWKTYYADKIQAIP